MRELPFASPVLGHKSEIAPTRCEVCGQLWPTTAEYFLLDENLIAKYPCCLECVRTDRRRKDAKRKEETRDTVKRLLTEQKLGKLSMPDEQSICGTMFKKFGGLERFCQTWKEQIDSAIARQPGSKTVLDQFFAMFKMATAVGDRVQKQVGAMSDQQLSEELDEMAAELVDRMQERQTEVIEANEVEVVEEEDDGTA